MGSGNLTSSEATAAAGGPDVQYLSTARESFVSSGALARWVVRWAIPIGLAAFIVAVYMPALDAGLVGWDDDDLLLLNTRYHVLSVENVGWMFTTSYTGHFQPLAWMTYALDWVVWKRELFGYHLTNVLLHTLTALAFYFVARRLLVLACGHGFGGRSRSVVLSAGFAAALFALHPLRVESVAWLAERRDVLAGFFFVLAIGSYLRYAGTRASRRWWYAATLSFCVLSFLSKASAVTLPVVMLVLDVYPLRRWRWDRPAFKAGSPASSHSSVTENTNKAQELTATQLLPVSKLFIEKLPFFLLALLVGVRAVIAQDRGGALSGLTAHDIPARIAQACYGLQFYLWKTLWPTNLGPLYEMPSRAVLFGTMLWTSLAVLVVVVVAVVLLRHRWPAVTAVFVVYIVMLLPVLGFAQSGPQLVADRYSYLPCMGFALLLGGGLLRLLRGERIARSTDRQSILALAVGVIVISLGRATFLQAEIWTSPKLLWARGVRACPDSAIVHTNFADALFPHREYARAAYHYRRALELNPRDAVALHHRGDLYRTLGRSNAAIGFYVRALRIDPTRDRACLSLARLLIKKGEVRQAVAILQDGARRKPEVLDLVALLADLLSTFPDEQIRDGREAVKWAEHVSKQRGPDHAPAMLTLATAYAEAGRYGEAVETAEQALTVGQEKESKRFINEVNRRLALFRKGVAYHHGVESR